MNNLIYGRNKLAICLVLNCLWTGFSATAQNQPVTTTLSTPGDYIRVQRDANSRVWRRTVHNNFANAAYRGIGLALEGGSVQSALIINNILGEGSTFHVQLPFPGSFGWFLYQNEYLNTYSNSVPPFMDPLSSSAHISN
jgi:hypothetical protein